ncbi:MAG: hypothetical protein AAF503_02540 [Pseudomonadota bacterium]
MRIRWIFAGVICLFSGCSFVDEVHVTLGDGVRLISINDRAVEISPEGAAVLDEAISADPQLSGDLSVDEARAAVGFDCVLEQTGKQSSLLASLFSRPDKTSRVHLICKRNFV